MTSDTDEKYDETEELLRRELRQHIDDGNCEISRKGGRVRIAINSRKSRQAKDINDIINVLEEENAIDSSILKTDEVAKHRKIQELPDASKKREAEVNRTTTKLNPRISREHIDRFNRCAKSFGSQREALEHAIELLERNLGVLPDNDLS